MRSKFWKNFSGIIVVILITLITSFILFRNLAKNSNYKENGVIRLSGIEDSAYIYRDEFSVPHISASSLQDLYFLMGYTHAQTRLWQMDFSRRIADGRLSEILGKEMLEYDKLFRTIGIGSRATGIYNTLPKSTLEIIDAYTKGVNTFITANIKNLPMEFDILNYKPELWSGEDCIKVLREKAWEQNLSWNTDYMFGQVLSKFGAEKSKDFFPDYPSSYPDIVSSVVSEGKNKNDSTGKLSSLTVTDKQYADINTELGEKFIRTAQNFKERFNLKGSHIGSNSWVVAGSKTESGKPLLANDPHLPMTAPSGWIEMELINRSDNKKVFGFGIPGVPGILSGSNNFCSWGITSMMNDESDFYLFKKDSLNKSAYYILDKMYMTDSELVYIKVKDEKDEVPLVIYQTKYGPVISGLSETSFISKTGFNIGEKYLLTYRWTGNENSDEIGSIAAMDFSAGWNEFRSSLKNFCVPSLNFIYADTSGNIGYQAAGKIPIRKYKDETGNLEHYSLLPSSGELQWNGFVAFDDMPRVFNPDKKFIVAANNKPQNNYKYFISNLFEPPYRAMRIEELLRARNNFTASEFELIQNDVKSLQAKEYCAVLFKAYGDTLAEFLKEDTSAVNLKQFRPKGLSDLEFAAYSSLKNWNYEFSLLSYQASVFSAFESRLYENLYRKEMGNDLFESYMSLASVPVRNTSKLFREKQSAYYDILRRSFKEALQDLQQKFNSQDITKWTWGAIHQVKIKNPLSRLSKISPLFDVGPYDIGGNGTTINCMEYTFPSVYESGSYDVVVGPSFRFVIDMSDTKSYQSILPPGQSGQLLFSAYRDQSRLWLNGEYKNVYTSLRELKTECRNVLVILPK
jgi:penicillin amidase